MHVGFITFLSFGISFQAEILRNYNQILETCNALDYHDLISCSVKLLTAFPEGIYYSSTLHFSLPISHFSLILTNSLCPYLSSISSVPGIMEGHCDR